MPGAVSAITDGGQEVATQDFEGYSLGPPMGLESSPISLSNKRLNQIKGLTEKSSLSSL